MVTPDMVSPVVLVLLFTVVVNVAPDVEPVAASHEPVGSKAEVIVAGTDSAGTAAPTQQAGSHRHEAAIWGRV
ncbi:hypothetical protein PInf_027584 [Phytophthora infestans]|nr:hypothetical protein PInf_027584 [Phytophthora infestans]